MARPTTKNPTGAQIKPKRNPQVYKKLEEAYALDCSVDEACLYAGITTPTFYSWMKDEPELFTRLKALKHKPVLKARKTIVKNLNQPEHAKWYLERKRKDEFSPKNIVEGAVMTGEMTEEHAARVSQILMDNGHNVEKIDK